MEKDKGYEFLFGDNKKSGSFQCADGSEGYIYSDGSGYYHGADGSDGYIYSDGSGYFHGADGSDGYKYSDGSGYFRGGSNDVDAYQYSDGSGYYGDSKHNRSYYQPVEKMDTSSYTYDSSSSSEGNYSMSDLNDLIQDINNLSRTIRQQEERERQEKRRQERREFCKRHWKGILISIFSLVLFVIIAISIWQFRKMIPMGYDSNSLLGMNYEQAIMLLNESGFTNVQSECTADLVYENIEKENQVYQVYIFGKNYFDATDKYPYDTKITVKYHGVKLIPVPYASNAIKGINFEDLVAEFEAAGFANIQLVVKYDIITGWLTDDGEVESVTINGDKRFTEEDSFRPDAEIVIIYHTLKKNKEAK